MYSSRHGVSSSIHHGSSVWSPSTWWSSWFCTSIFTYLLSGVLQFVPRPPRLHRYRVLVWNYRPTFVRQDGLLFGESLHLWKGMRLALLSPLSCVREICVNGLTNLGHFELLKHGNIELSIIPHIRNTFPTMALRDSHHWPHIQDFDQFGDTHPETQEQTMNISSWYIPGQDHRECRRPRSVRLGGNFLERTDTIQNAWRGGCQLSRRLTRATDSCPGTPASWKSCSILCSVPRTSKRSHPGDSQIQFVTSRSCRQPGKCGSPWSGLAPPSTRIRWFYQMVHRL